ncbi:hypothetical protein L2E82_01087 [Cichorium intybus]|uniref:Uncharacterized protein n=1 Tax=Cichorium intybus TaxID=13427 RepID=A0ACB9GZ26_CICIN|nr:hypothetical protein L2E82_01087 [Cichorium intybus]
MMSVGEALLFNTAQYTSHSPTCLIQLAKTYENHSMIKNESSGLHESVQGSGIINSTNKLTDCDCICAGTDAKPSYLPGCGHRLEILLAHHVFLYMLCYNWGSLIWSVS